MDSDVVSIIIPLYNVEKTISKCLNSIVNQSWFNLDIILIDNGCNDNTISIIKGFEDTRIRILSEKRKGASAARNLGLAEAKGDFLLFVDSDDYIELNMVEKLIENSNENSMIFCNTIIHENNGDYITKVFSSKGIIDKRKAMIKIATGGAGLVCSKLVSRRVVSENNISFNEEIFWSEDQLFFLEVASYVGKFIYVEEALYHYDKKNQNSTTNKYQENLVENFINLQDKVRECFIRLGYESLNDKKVLNNKIKRWFWDCIDNEVKVVNNTGVKVCFKAVKTIVKKVRRVIELDYIDIMGITDKVMYRGLIKESTISILNVMLISKLLMIKNG